MQTVRGGPGRRGVGVCVIRPRAVPVSRLAGLCGKVCVTVRCVRPAEPQLLGSHPLHLPPPPAAYTHLQGLGGAGPLFASPTSGGTSQAWLLRQVWGPAEGVGSLPRPPSISLLLAVQPSTVASWTPSHPLPQ